MDTMLLSAMSGFLGTLAGGSATVATAWITQRKLHRRELVREEIRKREVLYGEFIAECAKVLLDAFTTSLASPQQLVPVYALINRVRLTASPPVLSEAERLLSRVTDQYFSSNLTVDQLHELTRSHEADPLKPFGEACRMELNAMWAQV